MEYYAKDPLIFHTVDPDPFEALSNLNSQRIQVTEAQRLRTLVQLGTKVLREGKSLAISAVGRDCHKAVSCAEILKTNLNRTVYQVTHVKQMTTKEVFSPLVEGMNSIQVQRSTPILHILLSLQPILEGSTCHKSPRNNKNCSKTVVSLRELQLASANEENL